MGDEVIVERRGRVLIVTMNRPQARNAVNVALSHGVAAAFDRLDADPELVIGILTGAGNTFSSGMDLKAFARGERPEIEGRGLAGITETPPRKPTIAAVEGYALAGGCELALACDLIVAAEDAVFGIPEVTRGLVAGSGGLLRLPRRIPSQIAMEYALTGDRFGASEAHAWGLVNRLAAPGAALDSALVLAARIARNAPLAIQMTKRLVSESADWTMDTAWGRQRSMVEAVLASSDAVEGARAFEEKRDPVWRGT